MPLWQAAERQHIRGNDHLSGKMHVTIVPPISPLPTPDDSMPGCSASGKIGNLSRARSATLLPPIQPGPSQIIDIHHTARSACRGHSTAPRASDLLPTTPIRVPPTAPRRLACSAHWSLPPTSAHWSLPPISTPSVRAGIPWFLAVLHVGRSSALTCLIGWVDRPRSRLGSTCRHLGQPGQPTGQK